MGEEGSVSHVPCPRSVRRLPLFGSEKNLRGFISTAKLDSGEAEGFYSRLSTLAGAASAEVSLNRSELQSTARYERRARSLDPGTSPEYGCTSRWCIPVLRLMLTP